MVFMRKVPTQLTIEISRRHQLNSYVDLLVVEMLVKSKNKSGSI